MRVEMYVDSLRFDGERWSILLTSADGEVETIVFEFVRSMMFYKESDFSEEISNYEQRRIIHVDGRISSVFEILNRPILDKCTSNKFGEESPRHFGVWTADECFEFICFEEPMLAIARR